MKGRIIKEGRAEGIALVSQEPLGFFGGVDPETGMVTERGHELEGQCMAGRILVFPKGRGSTVGSYTLYRLRAKELAPAGIINAESEAILAVGAIIADIPMVDQIDISRIKTGDRVAIAGAVVKVEEEDCTKAGN